ncbi:hypothetical protein C4564_02715 [Candidatus Microgenomates bacterium]|nr:MAG: hypothetical protein C4564_02715 [Candidatus Microgenomates bacterium]
MLTKYEKDFLKKIPLTKIAHVEPFNPKAKKMGEKIVEKLTSLFPNLDILFMGSTPLEISGKNDIDIYVLSPKEDFNKYLPVLEEAFGKAKSIHETFVEWEFTKNNFEVEVYLTEPPEQQIKIFNILKSDKKLLREYENIKKSYNGKSYREYQRAKYEFYHRILPTDARDFLGKVVEVIMDRPLRSKHPKHGFEYEANYGYIPNTKSPDGEELDAYYLGTDKPLKRAKGICIAVIHRTNDDDDKLVIVPKGVRLTDEEIDKQTRFQEQWFEHEIIRK